MLRNLEKGKCQGSDLNRRQIPTTAPLDCRSRSSASLTCVSSALHSPFMVRLSYLGSLRAVLGINISLSGFELQLQQVQSLLNSRFWRTIFEPLPNQIFRVMFDVI